MKKQFQFFLTFIVLCNLTLAQQLFPHIIWLYWNTGQQNLGGFQKMCLQRVRQMHKQTDWEVRFVQETTIKNWLNTTNYERFIQSVSGKQIRDQTKADMVRYHLLKQHGGVWMDISIVLKQNLNWMDDLLNNPKVFHRKIFKKPQIFIHFQDYLKPNQERKIDINGHPYYPLFLVENAFIGAVKQSQFMNDLIQQFQKVLIYGQKRYLYFKSQLGIPNEWSAYFMSFRSISINLYRKYYEYQEMRIKNQEIKNLEDHFYKVLIMDRQVGMYHGSLIHKRIAQFLIQQEGKLGDYEPSLIKISHGPSRQVVLDLLSNNLTAKQQQQKIVHPQLYNFGQQYVYQKYDCLYKLKIYEDSAFNKYFLDNKQLTQKYFPDAQIIKNSDIPLVCRTSKLIKMIQFYPILCQWLKISIIGIIIVQLFNRYFFYIFKVSKKYIQYQRNIQNSLFFILVIFEVVYFQKHFLYSQYQLWKIDSPTALLVAFVAMLLTIILLKQLVNIDLKKTKRYIYMFKILAVLLIQYYFAYNYLVWKYQGEIYKYENLNRVNKLKIQEFQYQIMNILISMFLICDLYFCKWIFGFNLFQKQKKKIEFFQETKGILSNNQKSRNQQQTYLKQKSQQNEIGYRSVCDIQIQN